MDRSFRQKINREIRKVTDVITQVGFIDIYRIFHPNTKEYAFAAPHETFSRTDHLLGLEANLNSYKKLKYPPLLDHYGLNLGFHNNTKYRKPTSSWKLNNAQLNHQ